MTTLPKLIAILRDIAAGRKNAMGDYWHAPSYVAEAADRLEAAQALQAAPEGWAWVDSRERLPTHKDGPVYLTYSPARGVLPAHKQYWANNLWNYLWGKDVDNGQWSDVTHWRPLPAAPSPSAALQVGEV